MFQLKYVFSNISPGMCGGGSAHGGLRAVRPCGRVGPGLLRSVSERRQGLPRAAGGAGAGLGRPDAR